MEPDTRTEIQMKVQNEGNSPLLVLLDAKTEDGWEATVETQSGGELVNIPAFSEVTFKLIIESSSEALNGDEVPIVISAKPYSETQSFPDEYTAKKTVNIQVSINDPLSLIVSEVFGDRIETKLIAIGIIVLLVAWIVGRRGRVEYVDEWIEDDELDEEEIEKEFDLPEPISDDSYDDEDIELVDLE